MTKIADIIACLNEHFPLESQDNWDNSGLIVGNPDSELKGILLTVDINEERVQEAISRGCNLIVAHHPILFHGIKKLNGKTSEERTIIAAIKNDIALCAFHTPADKSLEGTSHRLGEMIGLTAMEPLTADQYGVIGVFEKPMQQTDFINLLKSTFNCSTVRCSEHVGQIQRVAICTGSGSEFIPNAIAANADAYITGDVKYHQFQTAEKRILIADIGHYESEELTKQLFFEIIQKKFTNFAPCKSNTCSNYIKYY